MNINSQTVNIILDKLWETVEQPVSESMLNILELSLVNDMWDEFHSSTKSIVNGKMLSYDFTK